MNTGIEPQITVNFGTRDSIDARNLVEYTNGDYVNQGWTDTLLSIAGNNMDLISIHQGIPYIPDTITYYSDQQVYEAIIASPISFKKGVEKIENKFSAHEISNVTIALTEWWEDYQCSIYKKHENKQEYIDTGKIIFQ